MAIPTRLGPLTKRKKWVIGWVFAYAILLLISHAVRLRHQDPWTAPDTLMSVSLPVRQALHGEEEPGVVIRYIDTAPHAGADTPVILLVHGSPMGGTDVFPELADRLKGLGRILAPDLPGFGYSTRTVDDYGFASHADYLIAYLDQLQVRQVHLVAYSMGGGAAIHMATAAPDRIASLTLISSIGVQELELLGDYHLNHALHGLQLGALWAVQELTPHMGFLDRFSLNTHFARNFFDSDQRPLRKLLRQISQPTLILHGENDPFVPFAAAREHHRLVPHSDLKTLPGGHLAVFQQTAEVAAIITHHIGSTLNGRSRSLAQADPSRRQASMALFGQIRLPQVAGLQLFIYAILIALATLISEDLACIGAGMMAARGIMGFVPATLAAFAGIVIGDLLLFAAGRYIGRPAIMRIPLRWFIKADQVASATQWFSDKGPGIILASRFLPGSRLPVYFSAGVLGGHVGSFLFYFCIAAAIWTPGLVGLAMWTGESVLAYYASFHQYALWVALATMVLLWIAIRMCIPRISFLYRCIKKMAERIKSLVSDE